MLLVLPANPHGSVSTIKVDSSRLWPCLCSPVPTHLSHQCIQTLAPLVSSPPPRLSASATCLKSPTPHIFWQRSAMLRTIWRARFFFPSVGGCHEGSAQSCQRITAEISGSGEGSRNMQQTDKHRSKTGKVVVLTLNCGSTASTICFFNACLGCYRCGLPQRQARFKANGSPRRSAKFLGSKLNKLLMGEAFLSHYRTLPPECP